MLSNLNTTSWSAYEEREAMKHSTCIFKNSSTTLVIIPSQSKYLLSRSKRTSWHYKIKANYCWTSTTKVHNKIHRGGKSLISVNVIEESRDESSEVNNDCLNVCFHRDIIKYSQNICVYWFTMSHWVSSF